MKKTKVLFSLLLLVNISFSQTNRYEIKSGVVEYDILGFSKNKNYELSGTSTLYFKDFGSVELVDEKLLKKEDGVLEEERNIQKIIKNKLYITNFDDETIYSQDLTLEDELSNIKNKDNLTQMGAKFLGNENILNYKCDIWELGEYKIWLYNSVILKQLSKFDDIEHLQIAKNANFNVKINDSKFKLPNFPIKKIDRIIQSSEEE